MCAGERVDAIDLNEPEGVKNTVQVRATAGARSRTKQQVLVQKQKACALIVQDWACHAFIIWPMLRRKFNVRF